MPCACGNHLGHSCRDFQACRHEAMSWLQRLCRQPEGGSSLPWTKSIRREPWMRHSPTCNILIRKFYLHSVIFTDINITTFVCRSSGMENFPCQRQSWECLTSIKKKNLLNLTAEDKVKQSAILLLWFFQFLSSLLSWLFSLLWSLARKYISKWYQVTAMLTVSASQHKLVSYIKVDFVNVMFVYEIANLIKKIWTWILIE